MIFPDDFGLCVSRETSDKLDVFRSLLIKWNPRINLVAHTTLVDVITRHFSDSAQLVGLANKAPDHWVDIGSGGGFPGLVVAILLSETSPRSVVTMIESDSRKAAFLRTVLRDTRVPGTVLAQRIEDAEPQQADVLSARALAPLPKLLSFADRHLSDNGTALLMKGQNWEKELSDARRQWHFSYVAHKSKTNANAMVLQIGDLVHV